MDEEFQSQLYKEIDVLVRNVAEKRGVDIEKYVFAFLANLLLESYEYRREEWRRRLAVDDDAGVFRTSVVIAERLLMEAKPYTTPKTRRGKSLLLIGIIDQIRRWWCSWPLCS